MQLATAGAIFVKGMISVLIPAHKGEGVFTSTRVRLMEILFPTNTFSATEPHTYSVWHFYIEITGEMPTILGFIFRYVFVSLMQWAFVIRTGGALFGGRTSAGEGWEGIFHCDRLETPISRLMPPEPHTKECRQQRACVPQRSTLQTVNVINLCSIHITCD